MPRIIIDTDPGVDDAVAILMALAAPSVEVAGLTVVGGNVPHARCLRNALALLEYTGRDDIPVFRGSSRPLSGKFPYGRRFHGWSGLSRRLPEPCRPAATGDAVSFLADQLEYYPGEITLVALGPLTNLARAERQRPGALARAASLVVMGGAVRCPGNSTPHAEFNFYSDPLAAQEVLAAGVPLTLVDLGACRQVAITRQAAAGLRATDSLGRLAVELVQNWFGKDDNRQRFEFYDPLALAAALEPALLTRRQVTLAVETAPGPQLAASRVIAPAGPVSVVAGVEGVDARRFFSLMGRWLGWEGV